MPIWKTPSWISRLARTFYLIDKTLGLKFAVIRVKSYQGWIRFLQAKCCSFYFVDKDNNQIYIFFQTSQENGYGEVCVFGILADLLYLFNHILLTLLRCVLKVCLSFRKIEIVQFASRTRQLFVRLLALVKWASNAGKVEKCAVCWV